MSFNSSWRASCSTCTTRRATPAEVRGHEFRRYLKCGLHAHGVANAVGEGWGDELLLPFSCKLRGICPSCNARRMANTAAHLIDHVIAPDLTLRQWVLTVPFELRLLLWLDV